MAFARQPAQSRAVCDDAPAQQAAGQEPTDEHDDKTVDRALQHVEFDEQHLLHRGEQHDADQRPEQQARTAKQRRRDRNQSDAQIEHCIRINEAELPGLDGAGDAGKTSAEHQRHDFDRGEANAGNLRHLLVVANGAHRVAKARPHEKQCRAEGGEGQNDRHVICRNENVIRGQRNAFAAARDVGQIARQQFAERHNGKGGKSEIVALQSKNRQRQKRGEQAGREYRRGKSRDQRHMADQQQAERITADAIKSVVTQIEIAHLAIHPIPALRNHKGDQQGKNNRDDIGVEPERQQRQRREYRDAAGQDAGRRHYA